MFLKSNEGGACGTIVCAWKARREERGFLKVGTNRPDASLWRARYIIRGAASRLQCRSVAAPALDIPHRACSAGLRQPQFHKNYLQLPRSFYANNSAYTVFAFSLTITFLLILIRTTDFSIWAIVIFYYHWRFNF